MLRIKTLEPEFVLQLPDALEDGKLYISMEFATSAHTCCCGCGSKVVTPFAPTDWSMSFDGETVSLHPSIGNWYLPCRSHYIIRKGRVIQARLWSEEEIEEEWQRDRQAKADYFQATNDARSEPDARLPKVPQHSVTPKLASWWPFGRRIEKKP